MSFMSFKIVNAKKIKKIKFDQEKNNVWRIYSMRFPGAR